MLAPWEAWERPARARRRGVDCGAGQVCWGTAVAVVYGVSCNGGDAGVSACVQGQWHGPLEMPLIGHLVIKTEGCRGALRMQVVVHVAASCPAAWCWLLQSRPCHCILGSRVKSVRLREAAGVVSGGAPLNWGHTLGMGALFKRATHVVLRLLQGAVCVSVLIGQAAGITGSCSSVRCVCGGGGYGCCCATCLCSAPGHPLLD